MKKITMLLLLAVMMVQSLAACKYKSNALC